MYPRNIHIHQDNNLKVRREKTDESDMKILLTVLSLCLGISFGYDLSCPDVSQWSIRARLLCPDPSKYYCLWDGNAKAFKENCSKVDLTRAGERLVIQYNFDSKFCPKDVYQPYPHFTNESSGCIYKKSTCNEEGQVVYDDTDTKHDVKCTCDYTRGYDFITRPNNPCFCIPSEEDCSCYLNPCMMPELESDARCTNTIKLSNQDNCAPLKNSSEEDTQDTKPIMRKDEQTMDNVSELDHLNGRSALGVFVCIIAIIALSGIIVRFRVTIDTILNKKIRKDDTIKKAAYLDVIKNKTEKRFYIRVMIVGKHRVGKSCLLRRLLGQGIKGVESTDGIDIVVRRCKIRISDGKWILDADPDPRRLYATRIKRAMQQKKVDYEKTVDTTRSGTHTFPVPNEHSTHDEETNKQEEVQISETAEYKPSGQQPETFASESEQKTHNTQERKQRRQPPTESLTSTRNVTKVLTHDIEKELEDFLSSIETYENENEEYVEIGFWDFAGQKDFYGTHYTFLDPHALYLLVTDCLDELKQTEPCVTYDSIGGYVDFWFDTIHSCNDVEEENTDGSRDPPIIAVCTGLDKLTKKVEKELSEKVAIEQEVNKKKQQYRQRYRDAIQDGQKRKHLRDIFFVSNTEPIDADFNRVRDFIFEYGKRFGEILPLKWIRLEQSLDVLRDSGINIVSRQEVTVLSKKCDFNEQEREMQVEKFLKHQHKNGSIIYNSDIKDFVILSQEWLSNAFKCLVSNQIDNTIYMTKEWEDLEKTGILEMSLITKLFEKKKELKFVEYQKHIIDVLNKFDIVGINNDNGKPLYYMPYMITTRYSPPLSVIFETFGASNEECTQSLWLYLEFDFFPLAFFTHVMLYYIRKYTICFDDSELRKQSIYHGVGVFFLDDTMVNKLIVVFCKNTIAIQIWYWRNHVAKDKYRHILSEIRKVIHNLKIRYEGHKLRYTVKVKCSEGDVYLQSGRISDRDLLDRSKSGEYFCNVHRRYHDSSQLFNTWFYKYSDDISRAEESKDTESVDSVRCQLCVSDPRTAVYWCTECVQAMCRECTTEHRTQPTSSTHTTVLFTHDYNFQIKGILIRDIASLCEGVLIISDCKGKQLITCDFRGHNKQFIPLPYTPFILSVIDQNNVAVVTYDDNKVLIVDVTQKNITKQFDIKKCCGIMYRDNHLYVGCDKSLVIVDMSGEIIRTVPLSFTPRCICSGNEERLYCTDVRSYPVYFIDTEGNTVFTVTNPDMSSPWGITTDNEGHVLVVCDGSNNVHRISPDGKQCNVIIKDTPSRNFSYPYICYDSLSKSIVIGTDDTVYVYKI